MKSIKTLTLRNVKPLSNKLEELKIRFNCKSSAQAIICSATNYIELENERNSLLKDNELLDLENKNLRNKIDSFLNTFENLKAK